MMAWAHKEPEKTVVPLERLKAKETNWGPSPISERDRWERDMSAVHYALDAEYDVDENLTLLRFKWSLSDEAQLEWQAPSYMTVLLDKRMPPYNVWDPSYGKKKI